jgi:hypothetical protein
MMFLLQLVLCLLSSTCFGMDNPKKNSVTWNIEDIVKAISSPYDVRYGELISGKLQLYYARGDGPFRECAARFISHDGRSIIRLNNFDGSKYGEFFEYSLSYKNLSIPLYIKPKQNWIKVLKVERFENIYEPEELLDFPMFTLCMSGDNVSLSHDNKKQIILHNPENIRKIRQSLSSYKQFLIRAHDGINGNITGKVTRPENDAHIWWDGWKPSFIRFCGTTSLNIDINDSFEVVIDLNKEKEEIHHYQRNKWISRGLVVLLLAGVTYQLKDKIYEFCNLLLQ